MELPKSGFFPTAFSALLRPVLRRLDKPSLPKYSGKLALAGLKKPVVVQWDSFAVPHVVAADESDLFFAQGYLHAQERLWQMDLSRRFLAGRMAELFGDFALPSKELTHAFRNRTCADLDYFMRLLGLGACAAASLDLLTDDLRVRLDAYCQGINRYIENCGNKPPWEFRLLRHQPEPWRPQDSIIIGKGFALLLSTSLYTRLNFIAIAEKLKDQPEKLGELLPGYPEDAPVIARATWDQIEALWRFSSGLVAAGDWHPAGTGSNSWTLAPGRTRTGGALLCNDPHLRLTLPAIWYLMHLKSEAPSYERAGYEVWGASIPGCPLIQIGHNRSIAWGITAAVCDDVEIYRERLHRLEPDRYLVGHEWRQLQTRRETISVRKSQPLEKVIRLTCHGPVISDFGDPTSGRELLSVRWTAHEPSQEMRSLYGVNRAADWQEFYDSLRYHAAPSLNVVYADRAGNIGYTLAGNIPLRPQVPSLLPVAGWDASNDWRGYIPFEELPHLYNPPQGFVATANNRITDSTYPYYLSHFFEPPYRSRRIAELVGRRDQHSAEDMARMQLDVVSLHAKDLLDALQTELKRVSAENSVVKRAAEQLLSWDGRCAETSVAAGIFHVFHHRLLARLLTPDLGEDLFSAYVEILNQCIVPTDRILGNPKSKWFAHGPRSQLVDLALRDTCAELSQALGTEIEEWRWGSIHTLHLQHSLGRVPVFRNLLGIGPLPAPGNGTTLNLGFYRHSNPYAQTVGASLRFMVDMGPRQNSQFILPSGQSGHPWSPHYADQNPLWRTGRRISLFAGEPVEFNTGAELFLEPRASL